MSERQVLVIGANGGVGAALTRLLLGVGDRVFATVSRKEKLGVAKQEFPGCAKFVPLDLSDPVQIDEILSGLLEGVDRLDAVVICGAVAPFAPAETVSFEMMRRTMEINCFSNLAIYQSIMPLLRKASGRLILISSYSGRVATPMMVPYVTSKFALEGMADVIRQEASKWGVSVILLQPGGIATPMVQRSCDALSQVVGSLSGKDAQLYGSFYEQMLARAQASLEDSSFTSPETVALAVIHAIETDQPLARYQVGEDAVALVAASREKSDAVIDAMMLEMYRSYPDSD